MIPSSPPSGRFRTRIGWNVADAMMSSGSNFLLTVIVARGVSRVEFGRFALAFSAYLVLLAFSRAFASDPLVVRGSELEGPATWRRSVDRVLSLAILQGIPAGLIMVGLGVAVTGSIQAVFLVFAISMPFLLLQDALRYVEFARQRPREAFIYDTIWTCVMLVAAFGFNTLGVQPSAGGTLAWGAGAAVACLFGFLRVKIRFSLRGALAWLRDNRRLSPWYAGEVVVGTGATQSTIYVVGAVAGLAAVGAIRGSLALMGPLTTVLLGLYSFVLPWFVRRNEEREPRLAERSVAVALGLALCAICWAIVIASLPTRWGLVILGSSWQASRALVLPAMLWTIGLALQVGPACALRAMRQVSESLRLRAATAGLTVGGAVVGAILAGGSGAMWGFASGSLVIGCAWAARAFLVERELTARVGARAASPQVAGPPREGAATSP